MLLALHILHGDGVALLQLGQRGFAGGHFVIGALLIHGGEARELLVLAIEAQSHAPAGDVQRLGFVEGGHHLAGQEAVVDQSVKVVLLLGQGGLDLLRRAANVRGTDGLMGVLGVLTALVLVGRFRQILLAEALRDVFSQSGQGLVADAHAVGTDIGDDTLCTLALQVNALVELLDDLHGLGGGEAQLAAGLLLQAGGGEGSGGHLALLTLLHAGDSEGGGLNPFHGPGGFLSVGDGRLLTIQGGQAHAEVLPAALLLLHGGLAGDLPVFLGDEVLDVLLPHDHHAGGHGLHATGGQALLDLRPQQRTDLVAHQPVQHAPGLLSVHAAHVQGTWGLQGLLDGLLGDLMKLNAAGLVGVDAQNMAQVPGDRFAFAVRVGSEVDLGSVPGFLADAGQNIAPAADGDVLQGEIVVHIHADLRLGQVAYVPLGCLHLVALAQEFADGAGLGGRLHNDELLLGCCHDGIASKLKKE